MCVIGITQIYATSFRDCALIAAARPAITHFRDFLKIRFVKGQAKMPQ